MINIIIADDHPVVRRGLIEILMEEYHEANIGEAIDGESLLNEISSKDWDLVICDLNMPRMNGLEVLRRVNQIRPNLPVIIMSISSELEYGVRALKTGAVSYLNKDNIHAEIKIAVELVLSGRKYITPRLSEKLADLLHEQPKNNLHEMLSNRELEIFRALAKGISTIEIAKTLSLASSTVSTYRSRIMQKLDLRSNADLTKYAVEHQLI